MKVLVTASLLVLALSAMAQQDLFQWRIAAHAGLDRSLGDIESSYSNVAWNRSRVYGLEISKALGYGLSLGLEANSSRLSGYDVKSGRNDRALNFMSKLRTVQLDLTFRMDNGKLLKYDARFAPFLSFGVGAGRYDTFGDLYSASGSRYYYWSDATIRDQAETGSNAATAQVIQPDGDFETRLTDLATEDGKPTNQDFLFIPARIGVKWRICDRFAAEVFYGFNWTFTDFIDDVHGEYPVRPPQDALAYASNPTGRTGMRGDSETDDKYHTLGLNLAYYFGRRSHSFRMNPIYVDDRSLPPPPAPKPVVAPKPAPPKPSVQRNVVINVERIVVGSLSVDTLVVGHLIRQDTATRDTSRSYTIRKTKLDSIMARDSLQIGGMDSLGRDSLGLARMDSLNTQGPDSLRVPLKLDTITPQAPDTARRLVIDSIQPDRPDSLVPALRMDTARAFPPDTARHSGMDRLGPASQLDTLIHVPVDTTEIILPDSLREGRLKQAPQGPKEQTSGIVQAPLVVQDTVLLQSGQPERGRVDTVHIDRPVPGTRFEQQTPLIIHQPEPRDQQVRTETRTVPVPVIVTKKETVKETVQVPVLQDSLRKLQVENDRLRHIADSLRNAATGIRKADTTLVKRDTTTMPPGIRAGDYAGIIARLQAARIATLERYIKVMDNTANAAETDSLKQRIAEMDKELEAMRASLAASKDSTAAPKAAGMEEVLLDTVTFSTGSSRVGSTARLQLLETGKRLAAAKVERVLVTGQTDRSGDAAFNKRLSQDRADAVKRVLVEAGVPIGTIMAKGLGEQLARHVYDEKERVVVVQAVLRNGGSPK
jgi:outer membrane protein OmpA-like peptidoglycan-associated protein